MAESRTGLPERAQFAWDETTKLWWPVQINPATGGLLVEFPPSGAGSPIVIKDGSASNEADVVDSRLYVDARATVIPSLGNTTTTPLAAGDNFTGVAIDISNFIQAAVSIFARPSLIQGDLSVAKASFFFEFSHDNLNWDISVPHFIRDPGLVIPIPLIHVGKYFRVRYVNDGGASAISLLGLDEDPGVATLQTQFRMYTYLYPFSSKELTRTLDQGISGSDPVVLVRSTLMGRRPTVNGATGGFADLPADGVFITNSTALLANGVFLSDVFDIEGMRTLTLLIQTNQVSATDGVKIEFSDTEAFTSTRTSTVRTFTADDVAAGSAVFIIFPRERYCRIRYTNGGSNQGSFFLELFGHSSPLSNPISSLVAQLSATNLAVMVRGVIAAFNDLGVPDNIKRSGQGGLRVSVVENERLTPIGNTTHLSGTAVNISSATKIVDQTAVPADTRSIMIQAGGGNTKKLYFATTSAAATVSGALWELDTGQLVVIEIGEGMDVDIWAAPESATQQYRLTYISGDRVAL